MLGKRLRYLREKRGLSQLELAKKLNMPDQNVSNYERGFRQPDYETLDKIASFFNVTTDYLLGRSNNPELSKEEQEEYNELEEIIESLPEDEKRKVINMIKAYADMTHASDED